MPPENRPDITRRTYLKLAGTGAAAATIAGCTGDGGDGDGGDGDGDGDGGDGDGGTPQEFDIVITQGQMPSTLDPHNHRETPTDNVVLHAYEGLMTRDRKGKAQAALATDWERQERGRVRFQIREDVQFHSGSDLTPEDVAYSINRIVDSETGIESPQSDQLAGVTGAEVVDGERAVDVTSDGLNPVVFSLFASYCQIMEQEWTEDREKSEVAQEMNGTGPFQLESYEEDVKVEFSRSEDYWRDPAPATTLTFRAAEESSTRVNQLLNGETDVIVNVPPQDIPRVKDADETRIAAVPSTRVIFNGMRYDVEPFSSREFRQAMNYAVDLDSIIENVLSNFGDPTGQPTLEGFVGYNPDVDPYDHDPSQAETLVDDSGHDGAELELHTPVGRYLKDLEIAQAVASQIDELSNVSCQVKQRDFGALAGELVDGNIETMPHFYLIGWGNATFDASQTIIPLLTCDGAVSSYCNEDVDANIEDAQDDPDADSRESTFQDVNATLNEEAPWVFLNRQYSVYGVNQRVDWEARRDERIDAYAMAPK